MQQQFQALEQRLAGVEAEKDLLEQQAAEAANTAASAAAVVAARAADMEALEKERSHKQALQDQVVELMRRVDQGEAEREALAANCEALRVQLDAANTAVQVPSRTPSLEVQQRLDEAGRQVAQLCQERSVLESSFRMQMEEAHRNFSAKMMEAEALKQQLHQANAVREQLQAAVAQQAQQAQQAPPAPSPAAPADESLVQAQNRQLQQRISAIEEEKQIMLHDMREHVMQLARENYDLKQHMTEKGLSAPLLPSQPKPNVPEAQPEDKQDKEDEPQPEKGSGWLSYVLSPFLTDSDMREIHAESYVDGHLGPKSQLVLT